tara:strand:+ start:1910 stop:2635 length:726 start_codon:yes stop_codon:yes gene_type:complete
VIEKPTIKKRRYFCLILLLFSTSLISIQTFKKVKLENIILSDNQIITREDIVENSYLNFPERLIFIKTKLMEKELKKNLSLQNISVNRQIIPFGLNISIKTRKPVAYGERLKDGKKINGFVDKYGYFINEKYSDKNNTKSLKITVFGWQEKFRKRLSQILNSSNIHDIEIIAITFSKNGFLTVEEKELKTIFLGFNPNLIENQMLIINNLKKQLKYQDVKDKIQNIDLTKPINPKIKVFKP